MSHTALLVIDAQRAFEHDPDWAQPATEEWLQTQNALIEYARAQGWPIAVVLHHSRGHFDPAGHGVDPLPGLATSGEDPRFVKHVHNALQAEGLAPWLRAQRIAHLVISGIRTEQCCETTTRAARDNGYEVDFVLDATLTFAMDDGAGGRLERETIMAHTRAVLQRRFATVDSLDALRTRTPTGAMNRHCPRSGKPVSADSLTDYRGMSVGFCNPGCRDDFAARSADCDADRRHFDRLIALRGDD